MEGGDSHDERLVRVRESLQRGNHIDRGVRNVVAMVTSLASRIGPVHTDQGVPRLILRQQWSALNVPLMWAAAAGDSENPVLLWLADECSRGGPVLVAGVDTAGREAVFEAWHALSGAMRSWGIQSREDLSEWIHRQGFVQPRWGGHFSGRAQERILTTAALTDARVSALESTYVQVVLRACGQTTPREAPHNGASARHCASGRQDESVANHPDSCWAVMDDVNLQDLFQERFHTLQSCPQSFRGRYRQHEAVNSRDELMEERAWKAFCLLPLLLFRRPVHERNVSKEDLRRRFDLFTNGAWEILVDEAVATLPVPVKPRSEAPLSSEHRGEKAAQKVRLGEITRARQCLTGAPLAPGNDNTFNELQRKRPQEVVRELPEHVRAFTPETPLVVNKEILLKSLKSSPRGSSPGPGGCTYEHLKVLMDDADSFNPRSSEGASQHLQGVDHGQTHGGHQERWRRARDRHRLLTPTFDRQNTCEAIRQGLRV